MTCSGKCKFGNIEEWSEVLTLNDTYAVCVSVSSRIAQVVDAMIALDGQNPVAQLNGQTVTSADGQVQSSSTCDFFSCSDYTYYVNPTTNYIFPTGTLEATNDVF